MVGGGGRVWVGVKLRTALLQDCGNFDSDCVFVGKSRIFRAEGASEIFLILTLFL